MTHLTPDKREALRAHCALGKSLAMNPEDERLWQDLGDAVRDSERCGELEGSMSKAHRLWSKDTKLLNAAVARVKELETQLANLMHVSSGRRDAKRLAERRGKNAEYRLSPVEAERDSALMDAQNLRDILVDLKGDA